MGLKLKDCHLLLGGFEYRHEDLERCQDRLGNHERHAVLCRHAVSSPHTLIDYLEGGGSLAASLETRGPARDTQAQLDS